MTKKQREAALAILDASLEDIKAGGWVCGALYGAFTGRGAQPCQQEPKCAVGLVTYHGSGQAFYPAYWDTGSYDPGELLHPPTEGQLAAEKLAILALASTIPAGALKRLKKKAHPADYTYPALVDLASAPYGPIEDLVIGANDLESLDEGQWGMTPKRAAAWFRAARKWLEAAPKSLKIPG